MMFKFRVRYWVYWATVKDENNIKKEFSFIYMIFLVNVIKYLQIDKYLI
jgi:hypothetical protein